jgi:hypothetical protein
MKPRISIVLTLVACFGFAVALPAQGDRTNKTSAGGDAPITVEFVNPEKYTDFGTRFQPTAEDREHLARQFRKELHSIAQRYVPDGYHLTLRILNIDMAGDFEPSRGPSFSDVRIMKAIYPPSIHVEYRVTGANGEVVSSGRRRMTDLAYQNLLNIHRDDRLFYETELARDLVREIMSTI